MANKKLAVTRSCAIAYCDKQTAIHLLMCKRHWYQVPRKLQQAVTRTYNPGQETTGRTSPEYIAAAKAAISVVEEKLQLHNKPTDAPTNKLNITADELNDPAYDAMAAQISEIEDQRIINEITAELGEVP
jgi:hypothetical protein